MNTTERKIFAAHKKAGEYCGSGMAPTKSLIKVANENDLNPEMTKRVAEMLNISLTKSFMKSASDKTATFPLADCKEAIDEIFTKVAIHKVAKEESNSFSSRHSIKRKYTNSNDHEFFAFAKTADYKENISDIVMQAEGAKSNLKIEISKCAQDLLKVESECLNSYSDIISHFRTSVDPSAYSKFETQCYSDYGTKVAHYLDSIYEHLNEGTERGDVEVCKRAHYFVQRDINNKFDALMQQTLEINKIAKLVEEKKEELKNFEDSKMEFYKKVANDGKEEVTDYSDLIDFSLSKVATDDLPAIAQSRGLNAVLSADDSQLSKERTRLNKFPEDSFDLQVDNIRRQAILADLMNNDEIISKQNPQDVASAYNTLLSLSPSTTLQREVVRSVLRNSTANQATDPFTASQISMLEQSKLKNKLLADGSIPAKNVT